MSLYRKLEGIDIMEGWKKCELGDVITLSRGHDLPSQSRTDGIYPIVSSSGITGFHNQYKAKAPGVVTGRYGTIGEVFYIKTDYWPLNTTLFVKDFKGNNSRYISYLLNCLNIKEMNVAGAVPGVNRNHLHKIKVHLPPLPIQQKIATILSAYDDLIENNLKRIKLLEEIAQITYEEWFMRLRFPGYESTPFDAITGLPEGWIKKENGDCCEVSGGGTPSREVPEYWEGGTVKWFSPTDLSKANTLCLLDSSDKITELGLKKSSAKLMGKHTFMMTSRATIGLFGLIDTEYSTNQGFINIACPL